MFAFATSTNRVTGKLSHITTYISEELNPKEYPEQIKIWAQHGLTIHYFDNWADCERLHQDFTNQISYHNLTHDNDFPEPEYDKSLDNFDDYYPDNSWGF